MTKRKEQSQLSQSSEDASGVAMATSSLSDRVNHPTHYKSATGMEAIDVIESFGLGYALGNATKYILRAGRKDGARTSEDLLKAAWYLTREAERLKKEGR